MQPKANANLSIVLGALMAMGSTLLMILAEEHPQIGPIVWTVLLPVSVTLMVGGKIARALVKQDEATASALSETSAKLDTVVRQTNGQLSKALKDELRSLIEEYCLTACPRQQVPSQEEK